MAIIVTAHHHYESMASFLLEEDDEAFTEVLALLDEYNAAVDESPSRRQVSCFSRLSESAAWAAFEATHPLPQATSKHRNGAREMRRREVQFLRTCVKGLETQLNALKEGADQRAQMRNNSLNSGNLSASSALTSVWRELATHQLDQRLAVERENTRLKGALEDQKKLREMLQRALNTRVARRVMETTIAQEKRTKRLLMLQPGVSDQAVFEELDGGVDDVYQEAERVFYRADAGDGACIGVFGDKTLPFDVHQTARAAWSCVAQSFHHEKYSFSYRKQRRRDGFVDAAQDDSVVECFGVEIKAPERIAEFRIKQLFRRYVEEDRTVIAWRSFIDPAEFKGQSLHGIRFQEKGSMVIRPPSVPGNGLTMLRIWHVITPETLARDANSQFMQDLTDFVLGGSSSANTVQMIENMLVEQSRRQKPK